MAIEFTKKDVFLFYKAAILFALKKTKRSITSIGKCNEFECKIV
jgi:hypothetical protein